MAGVKLLLLLGLTACVQPTYSNQASCTRLGVCGVCGPIQDCPCTVEAVNSWNRRIFHPQLTELVRRPFFKFVRVFLDGDCKLWTDEDGLCASPACAVQECTDDHVNASMADDSVTVVNHRCLNLNQINDTMTASDKAVANELLSSKLSFCHRDEDEVDPADMAIVNLLDNPERYTGYSGRSAHRVWSEIYNANCFVKQSHTPLSDLFGGQPQVPADAPFARPMVEHMCREERVFYRLLSGVHASISIHLCHSWFNHDTGAFEVNATEFWRRFSPETTDGQGPIWLKNLYFTYLTVLRAVVRAQSLWETYPLFPTAVEQDGLTTREAVLQLVATAQTCNQTFDERQLFQDDNHELYEELRQHLVKVSHIMDCVGCRKCRLWGKLQVRGLATALKILFSDMHHDNSEPVYQLSRDEVVSLFTLWERLSASLAYLRSFDELLPGQDAGIPTSLHSQAYLGKP
eukprot:TRINITY_DN8008_c0_g1_i1.p1 TRINITY_DN8008_c0_g1~~TRINITY_DN8008_c0_g1_i1.p1  ORF type:complete len:460 (+),score=71.44 TRINITY_DN8008_c0_g1_i1:59-1438(+)